MTDPVAKPSTTHTMVLRALLLAVAVTAFYAPAVGNGFIWDDNDYVMNNATLRDGAGLRRIWFERGAVPQYYPLVHTMFWIEYHVWELWAPGYHLVNIALHACGVMLLWLLLRRLGVPGAWVVAAVFGLHPVHVESVAWITERKNVLSAVFYFASFLAYLRFQGADDAEPKTRRWTAYAASFLFFLCALLSKTVTCSLPAAILLVGWWKSGRVRARDVWPLVPYFLIGLALALNTAWMEKAMVGAKGAAWELSLVERCVIASRALVFYASKLLLPVKLTFIYPRWDVASEGWWQLAWAPAVVVCFFGGALAVYKRVGRGPLVALCFFAGTLFPALGFFDVYPFRFSFVADHFQYLASLGVIALVVAIAARAFRRRRGEARLAAGLLLVVLGVMTWGQTGIYKGRETLWRDTLRKNPKAWMAHNNLAIVLADQNELPAAIHHLQECILLEPAFANAHSNLGTCLMRMGQHDAALRCYHEAVRLRPQHAAYHHQRANLLADMKRPNEAMAGWREALRLAPDWADPAHNLAREMAQRGGDADETLRLATLAAEALGEKDVVAVDTLAMAYANAGRFDEAVRTARVALQRARAMGAADFAVRVEQRLREYEAGRAIRTP